MAQPSKPPTVRATDFSGYGLKHSSLDEAVDAITGLDEARWERRVATLADVEDDPTVLVEAPAGPRLWFQAVPESKVVKNRVHLDVRASDHARRTRPRTRR